jgi:Zn-finger nucleic acid-binding protein
MKCPQCMLDLDAPDNSALSAYHCPGCSGTWIRGRILHEMLERDEDSTVIAETLDSIQELEYEPSRRRCPKCVGRQLKAVIIEDTELDFCPSCKGLFFDPGEIERVFPGIHQLSRGPRPDDEPGFWASLLRFLGRE